MTFEYKLIKLVKDKKCLYHTRSRSNKNNLKRAMVWKHISDELGKPVVECKQRWRSLRDRFVREKKKLQNGSEEAERWELYDTLQFIAPAVRTRRPPPGTCEIVTEDFLDTQNSCEVESLILPDSYSFDDTMLSTESTSKSTESSPMESKGPFVVPNSFSFVEAIQNIPSTSKMSAAITMDSKEDFSNLYAGLNTAVNSKLLPDVKDKPLLFENVQNVPSTSKRSAATLKDPNEAFLNLIDGLRRAVDSSLMPEKDENDLFLECIGKKMKRLSERAKLRIQAKLLANVTEELLNE